MRKLLVLTAAAALVVSSSGCCGCFGKVRNWFHKGSPCGTRVRPATLGAPLTMTAPVMSAPIVSAPVQCVQPAPMCVPCCEPCDPCGDPCADPCGGYSTGYFGGYSGNVGSAGCAACDAGIPAEGRIIYDESQYIPTAPEGTVVPQEGPTRYDPRPTE